MGIISDYLNNKEFEESKSTNDIIDVTYNSDNNFVNKVSYGVFKMLNKDNYIQFIEKYFAYDHLPEHLQPTSKIFYETAYKMINTKFHDGLEMKEGLRKLLEAKDCCVRSNLDRQVII